MLHEINTFSTVEINTSVPHKHNFSVENISTVY